MSWLASFAADYHAEIDTWASDITNSLARRGTPPSAVVIAKATQTRWLSCDARKRATDPSTASDPRPVVGTK